MGTVDHRTIHTVFSEMTLKCKRQQTIVNPEEVSPSKYKKKNDLDKFTCRIPWFHLKRTDLLTWKDLIWTPDLIWCSWFYPWWNATSLSSNWSLKMQIKTKIKEIRNDTMNTVECWCPCKNNLSSYMKQGRRANSQRQANSTIAGKMNPYRASVCPGPSPLE